MTNSLISVPARPHILVADPVVEIRSPLVQRLEKLGYEVSVASTYLMAAELIAATDFSFAVMELRFEDADGFALINKLMRSSPGARVVIHSAFCNVEVAVRAVKAGATDVLPKPSELDLLLCLLLGEEYSPDAGSRSTASPNAVRQHHIHSVHAECNGNTMRAARELRMDRRTLQRLLVRASSRGHVNPIAPPL